VEAGDYWKDTNQGKKITLAIKGGKHPVMCEAGKGGIGEHGGK